MTHHRLVMCLTVTTFAYMAGFAALYIDRLLPTFRLITKALGTQLSRDADTTDGVRGGGAEPTRLMSRDLEVVFMAAYAAWQQRQEQLSIFEASE